MDKLKLINTIRLYARNAFRAGRTLDMRTNERYLEQTTAQFKEIERMILEADADQEPSPVSPMHWWQFHYLGTDYRVQGPKVNIECLQAMFDKLTMKQPTPAPSLVADVKPHYLVIGPNDETIKVHVSQATWPRLYEVVGQGADACKILNNQGYKFSAHNGWMAPVAPKKHTLHISDRGNNPDVVLDYTISDNGVFRYAWDKNLSAAQLLKHWGYTYSHPAAWTRVEEATPKVAGKPKADTPFNRNYGALTQAISEQKNCAAIMARAIELIEAGEDDDVIG